MGTDVLAGLASRSFQPRVYGVGAWTDNLHFAYDLVALLKPRLLVELGTDRGESYFCFCQSVVENRIGTRCFAVDNWRGDLHAGGYDETTFEQVSAYNRQNYANFSTLLRSAFDAALAQFADGAIDLLHLDGLHTEEAVRHDLERWLPKLRAGGFLLMHDVLVRNRGFGVWKVWADLIQRGRAFTFQIGPGLGVWQKGEGSLPPMLESLFTAPNESGDLLIEYYRRKAARLQQEITQQWQDGSIRQTAFAQQTIVQVFHTHDGAHREEDSVFARIGHESWKEISISLPARSGAAPLRIDFVSAFTTIDIASIVVGSSAGEHYRADGGREFGAIRVEGDGKREPHDKSFRLKITGLDPQLYLPILNIPETVEQPVVTLRLRISSVTPND
ncbi:MAG: class I SAM-dependent methyltransferase [Chthoniobacterales bacterium]|nr:class I SAM-dependent methyltransferase [Chthoniobacterales bacterium]